MPTIDLNALIRLCEAREFARTELRQAREALDAARTRRDNAQARIDRIEGVIAKVAPFELKFDTQIDRSISLDELIAILDPPAPTS